MNTFKHEIESKFFDAAHRVANNMLYYPKIAVIAGSGIMQSLDTLEISRKMNYSETGILPNSSVEGHQSQLLLARHNEKKLLIFTGRFHLYEGYSALETAYPIILAAYLGVTHLIITNAAGGINHKYQQGDIMLINDILDFTYQKYHHNFSLFTISNNYQKSNLFDNVWISKIKDKLVSKQTPYQEGSYAQVTGPNYETRAEIRMIRQFGADAIGMSTGIETQFAKALNLNTVACSLITNKSSEVVAAPISHNEVLETAKNSTNSVKNFIYSAIESAEIIE